MKSVLKPLVIGSVTLGSLFLSTSAVAVCDGMKTECGAAGASAAAGAGSGIFAMKKYKEAAGFEASNTKTIAEFSGTPQKVSSSQIGSFTQDVQEGDKVVVHYQLSERDNRIHHINVMEDKASSARSTAAMYRMSAANAAMPRTEMRSVPDGNGGTTMQSVVVPGDAAAAMSYTYLANSSDEEAAQFTRKAADARAGGPVPTYKLEHEFTAAAGTRNSVADFLKERMAADGKLLKITRMGAAQFAQAKKMIWAARGGVAGAVVGAGVAAEQLVTGAMKDKYDDYSNDSSNGSYGSYSSMRGYGTDR